jgi:glucose-1-phosphate thymidylyltransferase
LGEKIKGIILAGGRGTRLSPLTKTISKQLIPVYDKPLIYYPISTLMWANIHEIAIITDPSQTAQFINLLGDGSSFGIKISYLTQDSPNGIAESLLLAEDFLNQSKCTLILGDNIFHGPGLGRKLSMFNDIKGAQIFGYNVKNPEAYGVATLDSRGHILDLMEKPSRSDSKIAVPGLYFFDENAPRYAKLLTPSKRGELEVLDLLKMYLVENALKLEMLPRGTAWFDSGTFEDLSDASSYVRLMQERSGERVGDPKEVAIFLGLID